MNKSQAIPQFQGELKDSFTDQCTNDVLQTNINKTNVISYNPLKRDVACPEPWFPTAATDIILCGTLSADCSFSYHASNLVKRGN